MGQIKATIRRCFNMVGVDIRRTKNVPTITMLGLPLWPVRTIVDVGANQGQFIRKVRPLFPAAAIYCYEPLPSACKELQKLVETYRNIHIRQLALGESAGTAMFNEHIKHSPSSSLLSITPELRKLFPQTINQKPVEVRVSTLDLQFPEPNKLEPDVLLKLDVQGYEDRVLRGGAHFLRSVDIVIVECSVVPLYEGQASFISICKEMSTAGLSYTGNLDQTYDEHGRVIFLDAVFLRKGLDRFDPKKGSHKDAC